MAVDGIINGRHPGKREKSRELEPDYKPERGEYAG